MADEEVAEEESALAVVEEVEHVEIDKPIPPSKYEIRPGLGEKFQAENVQEIITSTMQEQLLGRQYKADQAARWAKMISNGVRHRVQELEMKRYKFIVQTVLLEMKGAGVKCGQRCIWDPETDDYIDSLFRNDTIFCHTTVYGVYMY